MDNEGLPTFITVIASAVLVIGVIVGLAAVTWMILFAVNV